MLNLLEKSVRIATSAHQGQKRKEADIPYISHPIMVAFKLMKYGFADEIIAAALVHDVLEDTEFSAEQLHHELGDKVFDIVRAVTNDDTLSWEDKKMKYVETVRSGPEGAKAVVIADKIHNAESLIAAYQIQGPIVWKNFNRGKAKKMWFEYAVLKMLQETWSHPMISEYERLIKEMDALSDV
jgi:(p)ppGpp synthase/HD superfamily hydrolase